MAEDSVTLADPVRANIYCNYCRQLNPNDAIYCSACGRTIRISIEKAEPPMQLSETSRIPPIETIPSTERLQQLQNLQSTTSSIIASPYSNELQDIKGYQSELKNMSDEELEQLRASFEKLHVGPSQSLLSELEIRTHKPNTLANKSMAGQKESVAHLNQIRQPAHPLEATDQLLAKERKGKIEIREMEIPANRQRVLIQTGDMAAADLSRALHSIKIRWIVCLVSAMLLGVSGLSSGGVSLLGMLLFALIGVVYSISCLIRQMKVLRNLKGLGVQANYWYVLMLVGLIFLFFGIVIEVGCFLLYGRRIYRRLSTVKDGSQALSEAERHVPVPSEFVPAQEQNRPRIVIGETGARDFCKNYSEKSDAELLQLVGNMTLLAESTRGALESELGRRGLSKTSTEESMEENVSQLHEAAKDVASSRKYKGLWILARFIGKYRGLWILVWFIALLIYNVLSDWSLNADKTGLYIFLKALGGLTTPVSMVLSAFVVFGISSILQPGLIDDEPQTLKKQLLSRAAVRTAFILVGTVALVIVVGLLVAALPMGGTKQRGGQAVQSPSQDEKDAFKPNALDSYEILAKPKAALGTADDGLPPETKKRMREMLALEMAGAMQKQNNPIRIDVVGDSHDVLLFQLPSMNDESANELIEGFRQGDANFWNAMRLMNYSQVVFSGDGYRKIVTKEEFIGYGKDYEEYAAGVLKAAKRFQTGAQAENK